MWQCVLRSRSCCCAACPYPQAPPADPTIVLDLNDPDSLAAWQLAMEGQPSESLQQLQLTYTAPAARPLSHPRRGSNGSVATVAAPAEARTLKACLPGLINSISALRLYQLGDTPRGWDHRCRPMTSYDYRPMWGCDFRPMRQPVPAGADWEPEEPSGGGDDMSAASAPTAHPWRMQHAAAGSVAATSSWMLAAARPSSSGRHPQPQATAGPSSSGGHPQPQAAAGPSSSGRHPQPQAAAGSAGAASCAGRHLVLWLRGIRGEVLLSMLEAVLLQVGGRQGPGGGRYGRCGWCP